MTGLILVLVTTAFGQQYRFPAPDADAHHWYPTMYFDQDEGGATLDWDCHTQTYDGHRGTDLGAGSWDGMDQGRDIVAAAQGTVSYTNDGEFDACSSGDCLGGGGFGNYVYVAHPDGKTTIYAHMKKGTVVVSPGDVVQCGDKLGQMGSSGYSTGPHLHFEVRNEDNDRVDPFEGTCGEPRSYWVDQGIYDQLPSRTCDGDLPTCEPVGVLTCGDVVNTSNDGPGSTWQRSHYGCSEWVYSGPEIAWRVVTDRDEAVAIAMTGLSADLDLYVAFSDVCDGTDCVASSVSSDAGDEQLSFQATAGHEYVVVTDGFEGAITHFTLTVDCAGGLPLVGDSGTDTDLGTSDTDPNKETDAEGSGSVSMPTSRTLGGCNTGGGALWWGLPLLLRRRRTTTSSSLCASPSARPCGRRRG